MIRGGQDPTREAPGWIKLNERLEAKLGSEAPGWKQPKILRRQAGPSRSRVGRVPPEELGPDARTLR